MNIEEMENINAVKIKAINKELKAVNERLDDLFIEVAKPIFSNNQILGFFLTIILWSVLASVFIGNIRTETSVNKSNINVNKMTLKTNNTKFDKIMDKLEIIQTDIATLKVKNNN